MLICPLCRGSLTRVERAQVCPRGHAFDLAREGYVNLLRSNHPGDTREMVAARRAFFSRGHYAPLAARVCDLAASHLESTSPHHAPCAVLDVGCGEGYYLGALRSHLQARGEIEPDYLGIDTSRAACRLASRTYETIQFAVADLKDLVPIADARVDLLLNIFAPRNVDEFCRVLSPTGMVLVVIPQPHHLAELRRLVPLIGIEEKKADHVIDRFEPSLRLSGRESLEYELTLEHPEILELVGMSPSHRHLSAPPPSLDAAQAITVAVEFLTFRRGGAESRSAAATSR